MMEALKKINQPFIFTEQTYAMLTGTIFALAAGLVWGLVFVAPLMLPQYPATVLSVGRYLAFGLIALPLAWLDRKQLALLTKSDWMEALKLSAVGNLLYYLCLAAAIQRAGAPLPTMVIGTLPVVIALVSMRRNQGVAVQPVSWRRLLPSLGLITLGIGLVNGVEIQHLLSENQWDTGRYATGALLALAAVACWTWYPLRNADWLRAHAERSPRTWATAQGVATLPLALVGLGLLVCWNLVNGEDPAALIGPTPMRFVLMMLGMGLLASWIGTLCWNEASQRLPTHLAGQLIVFETLAALGYAFALRGAWPEAKTALGIALLVAGVVWALRAQPVAPLAFEK